MASNLTLESTVKLRDGNEVPVLGFGTYELDGEDAYNAVTWALETGYRHIDSAEWYENEAEVGRAILDFCAKTGTPRDAVFYTTKLKLNAGYDKAREAISRSVAECGLGHVDLFLIHGPLGGRKMRAESWRACCDAKKAGEVKSIGISTFGVRHIQQLLEDGGEVPACMQIDLHPFMTREDVVAICKEHQIALEAWAPLVRGMRFKHPVIGKLARKHGKEAAQILLRYSLQKGYVAIPKSASKQRIRTNAAIFDFGLDEADMAELDGLDEYLVTDWDPTGCP